MSERRPIECDGHGQAWESYVCEHLLEEAKQPWFSACPDEENPCPDAWCAKCDAAFPHLTEPKWSATEHDGWHMSAVAVRELGALGIYRLPGEDVTSFVAILGKRIAS